MTIEYHRYRRISIVEMADWIEGFDMSDVYIGESDIKNGSPKIGDKIARNSVQDIGGWLVSEEYFAKNFEVI